MPTLETLQPRDWTVYHGYIVYRGTKKFRVVNDQGRWKHNRFETAASVREFVDRLVAARHADG